MTSYHRQDESKLGEYSGEMEQSHQLEGAELSREEVLLELDEIHGE
jgi:hypothetical protein